MPLLIKSTLENKKLVFNAIKAKILKHLEELDKEEASELKKTFSELTGLMLKGGKGLPVGTIREWKGKKFIKIAPGKWKPKYDSETRGARMSVAAIKRKAVSCEDAHSLMSLIFENKDRFSDENGAPLACVKELSDFIEQTRTEKEKISKKKSGTGAGNGGDDGGEPPDGKKGKLQLLNKKELHDFIEKHKTSKENVRVSLGEISYEARNRIKEKTGLLVNRVILDSDSVRHAYSKPQHNLNPNDLDDMKNIIETTTDIEMGGINPQGNPVIIFKKQEVNGVILCEEYRAKNKELELQTAYRIKKEKRQPHGANERLPANVRNATAPTTSIPQSAEKSRDIKEKLAQWQKEGRKIITDEHGLNFYEDMTPGEKIEWIQAEIKRLQEAVKSPFLGQGGVIRYAKDDFYERLDKDYYKNKYGPYDYKKYIKRDLKKIINKEMQEAESRHEKRKKEYEAEIKEYQEDIKYYEKQVSTHLTKSIIWLKNYLSKSGQKEESAIEVLRKRLEKERRV